MVAHHNKAAAAQQSSVPKPAPKPAAEPAHKTVPAAKTEAKAPAPAVKTAPSPHPRADELKAGDKIVASTGPGQTGEHTVVSADSAGGKTVLVLRHDASGKTATLHVASDDRVDRAGASSEPPAEEADKYRLTGLWSTSYRYSNKSFGTGKQGEEFASELHRLLATNKPPAVCGSGCQDAHKFLSMVDHDATVQHSEMQRGISLSTADAKRMFQPGKTADMPAASWTTKKSIATSFAGGGHAEPGKTKVILHTAPPAKGLDISGRSNFPSEQEVVTGGRYNVDKVQTVNGVMHVYVTQQDFSAH